MKQPSNDLFQLIHAMTPKEKQYFKQHVLINIDDDRNNYLLLFDAINNSKIYNETSLKQQFQSTPIGKNFKFYKHYLIGAVAGSIYDYQSASNYKSTIMEGCRIAEIYLEKELFELCKRQLHKMHALAIEHSFIYALPYIMYIETELAIKSDYKYYFGDLIEQHAQQVERVSNWIQIDLQLLNIFLKLIGITKAGAGTAQSKMENFASILKIPLLHQDFSALPKKQQRNQLAIVGNCYSMLNNNAAALEIRKKIIDMYGPINHIPPDSYKAYLSDFNNYLISVDRAGFDLNIMEQLNELLLFTEKKIFEKKAYQYLKYRTYSYVYNYKFNYYLKQQNQEQAFRLYQTIKKDFSEWEHHISEYEQLTFYKHFLIIEFMNANYKNAAHQCHTILQLGKHAGRIEVVTYAGYLLAICLLENDERRYLKSYLTKQLRYKKQQYLVGSTADIIYTLVNQLLSIQQRKEKAPVYASALKKLNAAYKNEQQNPADYFYDIRNWIKIKLLELKAKRT